LAGSGSWNKLYQRVDGAKGDPAAGHKARLAAESTRLLDRWCATATAEVATALRAGAAERSKAFAKATGLRIAVRAPSADVSALLGKFTMPSSFITLELQDAYVHLYMSRSPGEFPVLHCAVEADTLVPPASRRAANRAPAAHQRLVSKPACTICRGPDGRPRLRTAGTGEDGPLIKLDDVLFQAFEQLVDAFEAHSAAK
jgi:hypothetical protein